MFVFHKIIRLNHVWLTDYPDFLLTVDHAGENQLSGLYALNFAPNILR